MPAHRIAFGVLSPLLVVSALACGESDVLQPPSAPPGQRPGLAQKGPLVASSVVTLEERDATLSPTGNTFTESTHDDTGAFSSSGLGLTAPFVDVIVRGFYFDEVGGSLAGDEVTLRAIVDTAAPLANVNALTTISRPRVITLVTQGQDFTAATLQARDEALAAFAIAPPGAIPPSSMTIADAGPANAALLAVSAIVQNAARRRNDSEALVTAELNDILQSIATDLEPDGVLDDVALATELTQAARNLDAVAVRQNLEDYYASLGAAATIPAFEALLPVASGQFVAAGTLGEARSRHAAHLLSTGEVLVIGGFSTSGYDDAFLFDPVAESQGPKIAIGHAFSMPVTAAIGDAVYVFGQANDGMAPSSAFVFTETNNSFTAISAYDLNGPKQSFWIDAVALQDGSILTIRNEGGDQVEERFNPMMATITPTNATVSSHRWDAPSTVLPDGRVLFTGGSCCDMPDQILSNGELYFPSTSGWGGTSSPLSTARSFHTQTLLDDGRVLIVGGYDAGLTATSSIDVFDPSTSAINPSAATLGEARYSHTATKLADGRVLILGGDSGGGTVLASAEIYDPATDSIAAVSAPMSTGRVNHTATLLPDGSVLIIGGVAEANMVSNSVERFIP